MDLIIVESPSKAKTIEKYLGGNYKVDASGGHIRDLPEKHLGIDITKNFEPKYVVNPDKKAVIERLTEKAKKADKIYLATDPDREGEAISWHLAQILKLKREDINRIEFNEITKNAVKKAIEKPRDINYNLVDAQQARRVLDRLVGYKLSPLLCKRLQNGLSAGRVQSVALKMTVDREREILAFNPEEYYTIQAVLEHKKTQSNSFKSLLSEYNGKKIKVTSSEMSQKVLDDLKDASYSIQKIKKAVSYSHALPPFTTSTLQQDASAKLNFTSPQTMQIAQHLYEGVEVVGEGLTALITYIRTDSVRVSPEFQGTTKNYIIETFGKEFAPETFNFYKSKKDAQDAHEAIRPIDLTITPESIKDKIEVKHYKLYRLVYNRFLASQMSQAAYNTMNFDIAANQYIFKASGKSLLFKGFTIVYDDIKKDDDEDAEGKLLPNLTEGDLLDLVKLTSEQKFTKPPLRYTDATLVKAMEDKGIGRPSTYASIIGVLTKRFYIKKDGKYMVPTEIAFSMTDMLVKYFADIVELKFTAKMEDKLDEIEEGGVDWHQIIADFYPPFAEKLVFASNDGDEITEEKCEKCGNFMIKKRGRYGSYLACSNYPTCKSIKSTDEEISEIKCDKCGANMLIKNGKFGKFLACPNYPDCDGIKQLDEEISDEKCDTCGKNMAIRTGKFGKYLHCSTCKLNKSIVEKRGKCPICGKDTAKKKSKLGKIFYSCTNYPNCKFYSYDAPTGEKCPTCGKYLVYTKDDKEIKCIDKDCDYKIENPNKPNTEN